MLDVDIIALGNKVREGKHYLRRILTNYYEGVYKFYANYTVIIRWWSGFDKKLNLTGNMFLLARQKWHKRVVKIFAVKSKVHIVKKEGFKMLI